LEKLEKALAPCVQADFGKQAQSPEIGFSGCPQHELSQTLRGHTIAGISFKMSHHRHFALGPPHPASRRYGLDKVIKFFSQHLKCNS